MDKITIYQVDAFAREPFTGNPAAVCVTTEDLDEKLMRNIAEEMNLSETAFAVPTENKPFAKNDSFRLRWFTPSNEVDLCGHATLSAAKVLFDIYNVKANKITFSTRSGELIVTNEDRIRLDFPIDAPKQCQIPQGLLEALGVVGNAVYCGLSERMKMMILHIESEEQLLELSPNFSQLANIQKQQDALGVIVTAQSNNDVDFVSRFFTPFRGINEDPVTGAAHTVLAPYWTNILQKDKMTACQESSRRGFLSLEMHKERVHIIGEALIVMEGKLLI